MDWSRSAHRPTPSKDNDHPCPPAERQRDVRQERHTDGRCSKGEGPALQCRYAAVRQSTGEPARSKPPGRSAGG
eukprot:4869196-Alexandrium_andersonii.AAC.1